MEQVQSLAMRDARQQAQTSNVEDFPDAPVQFLRRVCRIAALMLAMMCLVSVPFPSFRESLLREFRNLKWDTEPTSFLNVSSQLAILSAGVLAIVSVVGLRHRWGTRCLAIGVWMAIAADTGRPHTIIMGNI
jgi:hypothetical protein